MRPVTMRSSRWRRPWPARLHPVLSRRLGLVSAKAACERRERGGDAGMARRCAGDTARMWEFAMTWAAMSLLLSLYVGAGLTSAARSVCSEHLGVWPVCRARGDELRNVRSGVAMLVKPVVPPDLVPAINM